MPQLEHWMILHPTNRVATVDGVECRTWEGFDNHGHIVKAYIHRLAVSETTHVTPEVLEDLLCSAVVELADKATPCISEASADFALPLCQDCNCAQGTNHLNCERCKRLHDDLSDMFRHMRPLGDCTDYSPRPSKRSGR